LFGIWANSFGRTFKRQLLAGALAFYWIIWLSKNDIVFDKTSTKSFFVGIISRNTLALVLLAVRKEPSEKRADPQCMCRAWPCSSSTTVDGDLVI
jgi:hypothetical protein